MRSQSVKPAWNFPPRNGGIDYVSDPSAAHFSDAPVPKLVREMIQNSLDAMDDGFTDPVVVSFTETSVNRASVGGKDLQDHIARCAERAGSDGRFDLMSFYSAATQAAQSRRWRCLRIQDAGTLGLDDARWNALVGQEGAIQKPGAAPGGSYGIGKNAVLNVSDVLTVFYSTRYVAGKRGRVEKMQGKATLMGHPDPKGSGEDLQHIGFFTSPDGSPIEGREIPEFFRLDETGTGVYVMGFNPRTSDWVGEVVRAVIENFFAAVHSRDLVAKIQSEDMNSAIVVNHESIDQLFEKFNAGRRSSLHYYRAIRDYEAVLTARLPHLGKLSVRVMFTDNAPRRVAHINRRGMLITDSREQKQNPLAPRGRGIWPDFAAVVSPDSDAGDTWLRRMENPSHDSLSVASLQTQDERREASSLLKRVRGILSEIIEGEAEIERYADESNVSELSEILPSQGTGEQILEVSEVETTGRQDTLEIEWENNGAGDEPNISGNSGDSDGGEGGDQGEGDGGAGENLSNTRRPRERTSSLGRVRIVPVSSDEIVLAFDAITGGHQEFSIMRAGADRDTREIQRLTITSAQLESPTRGTVEVLDGQSIRFSSPVNSRVAIRARVNGEAVRLGAFRVG